MEIFNVVDLCAAIHCSAGKVCKMDGNSAQCICIPECPELNEPRRKVRNQGTTKFWLFTLDSVKTSKFCGALKINFYFINFDWKLEDRSNLFCQQQ